ncbi:helix-turn-helix domain-containing protein [Arcicella sp. LKC2W]|uniref:helix-turn-helix transcriptional regulator n=1 Tax=Arcicella sp. LKC2W TaxID=2984198 RepID=UPI002B1F4099|nr:helix-turn-helix domain-containing protein [Arcicella sp. LKC2W]MEA5459860.1 helix-turn-helix domain-containing protein [Arcicella sp. LKC2W]
MDKSKLQLLGEIAKKPLFNLTGEELLQLFDQVVKDNLKDINVPSIVLHNSNQKQEIRYNYREAVDFLQVSRPTFGKLRREGKIKGIKVGERRVLFNRSELEAYLESNHE